MNTRRLTPAILAMTILCLISPAATAAPRDSSGWAISASPLASLPLAAADFSGGSMFGAAFGGAFLAERSLSPSLPLALRLGASYSKASFRPYEGVSVPGSLDEGSFFAGLGYGLPLGSALSLRAFADAGLAYGVTSEGAAAAYAALDLGAGLGLRLGPALAARLEASASYKAGLYAGLGASLGLSYALPAKKTAAERSPIEIISIEAKNLFPILRSFYDQHPVGTVKIRNSGHEALSDLRVTFEVRQYMDAPRECAVLARLEPGATVEVPLFGTFNDRILDVTEATKVAAEVGVDYGAATPKTRSATIMTYDRNALTWSDDRKAAAFVSDKDPWVLALTGQFIAAVKDSRNAELPKNFQTMIAIHAGLRAYGLGYMVSTSRPFAREVVDTEVVDSLKFPRQTLAFRSGDCADLSVLYASCLEAAGVETAFVTVPGHIFLAADLGLDADKAAARGLDDSLVIVEAGRVWIPIETTMRGSGFAEILAKGAEQWRLASAKGLSAFYPMHDSWRTYAPVGLPADGTIASVPPSDRVVSAFSADLKDAVDRELAARISALGAIPAKGAAAASALNNRGVLYGKYGRYPEAKRDFEAAAKLSSAPALVNLGNLALIARDAAAAYSAYRKAEQLGLATAGLYGNIAKAAAALGKREEAAAALEKARSLDPALADRLASLGLGSAGGTRAAEQEEEGDLSWF